MFAHSTVTIELLYFPGIVVGWKPARRQAHMSVLGREKDETGVQVKPLLQPLFGAYVSDLNAEHKLYRGDCSV